MKFLKIISVLFLLVVLLVGGGVWYMISHYDEWIKTAVETQGPKVTGTSISLADVNINLGSNDSSTELAGLVIGNPAGFDSEHLFKLDRIFMQLDPSSAANDVIVINDISIEGIEVIVEQKGTTTNVQTLLKNLEKNTAHSSKTPSDSGSTDTETTAGESAPAKRFMIEHLTFSQGSLRLITENFGEQAVTMPEIKLENLGDKTTGLTPEQMTKAILDPLLKNAQQAAQDELGNIAKEKVEGAVKDRLNEELEKQSGSLGESGERLKSLLNQ